MNYKHGYHRTPTYYSWYGMKVRCTWKKHPYYKDYGGRGIIYDPTWESFENFLRDMGERPEDLELDRKDNNLGYFKENCRWAPKWLQMVNTRPNRRNSSGVPGVCWADSVKKWQARASFRGERYLLYRGTSLEEAELAMLVWKAETLPALLDNEGISCG